MSDRRGGDGASSTTLAQRQLWIFYSDVRSRLNTLLAEFHHVRVTAYAHMKHGTPEVLDFPLKGRDLHSYPLFGIREKQYLAIADIAAHELHSLIGVRNTVSQAYDTAFSHLRTRNPNSFAGVYWFIAKRAKAIEDTLQECARTLQHLHDKLVQMLDTAPGAMPQPLYLRRWQSATHEKFLSAYCRDQSVETAKLVAFLNLREFQPDAAVDRASTRSRGQFEQRSRARWRGTVVSHVWNHEASSETINLDGPAHERAQPQEPSDARNEGSNTASNYALVRSVFFYLEQPILFPLLYHELAHVQMDLDRADDRGRPSATLTDDFAFLRDCQRAAEALQQACANRGLFLPYEGDFELITTEIWADAIGVSLGGAAFVHALSLQIFGQLEEWNVVRGRTTEESSSGAPTAPWHTQLNVHDDLAFADKPVKYFCFARILVSVTLAKALYQCRKCHSDEISDALPFQDELEESMVAIEALWQEFKESGAKVHGSNVASAEHEIWWRHYCEFNEWVASSCYSYLEKHVERMWKYVSDNRRHPYRLCDTEAELALRGQIWTFFSNFAKEQPLLEGADNEVPLPSQVREHSPTRLEDAALGIRWKTSAVLCREPACNDIERLDRFLDTSRWDGLAAFRYLLEWYQLLMSAGHRLHEGPVDELRDLASDLVLLFKTKLPSDEPERVAQKLLEDRFMLFNVSAKYESWSGADKNGRLAWIGESAANREQFENCAAKFVNALKQKLWQDFKPGEHAASQIPVSMLCLGVLRPSLSREPRNERETAYEALEELRKWHATRANVDHTASSARIYPTLGEYSYVRWVDAHTPTNLFDLSFDGLLKSDQTTAIPRHFEKPRMLLKICGSDFADLWQTPRHDGKLTARSPGADLVSECQPDARNVIADKQSEAIPFVRLSLIKFKHRAAWTDARVQLERVFAECEALREECGLFLSSGWEDVVFIRLHRSLTELQYSEAVNKKLTAFLEVKPDGVDVQSMLITAMPVANVPTPGATWNKPTDLVSLMTAIREYAMSLKNKKPYEECLSFGRYDGSLKWGGLSPTDLQEIFLHLPPPIFHSIAHLVHGVGWDLTKEDVDPFLFTRFDLSIH